ncbi:MAG TPA: 2,3-bisphosphoglycerate-independent phosphoglycerate mutase, partial [Gaiellaceae bacterium]|nr:2,3-bisphosphoglycerate-independent phosphoglycerate mutase [Gaiellaceae bacterium]
IESGELFANPALVQAFQRANARGGDVHLLGLVSYGGVHSHIDHLRALLDLARREGMEDRTWIHAFTDGRDVSPTSSVDDLAELPVDKIATIAGRYYAMDRDKRWDRTERALAALTGGEGAHGSDPVAEVRRSYDEGITDEFIEPVVLEGRPRLEPGDVAIVFNFRPDRVRQLTEKLLASGFDVVTMTRYREDFDCPVAFAEQEVRETLAEVLAGNGLRQLHVAETEKYAHVTYFFNGGREEEWPGEVRVLVPSPRDVPSYDHKPEMSAPEVTDRFVQTLESDDFAFAVLNFANPDMVGHTGSIPAAVRAVETVDTCLARIVDAVERRGGVCLITADHGNAEQMLDDDGGPHTAHTTNLVPLVLTDTSESISEGELADLAPTALAILGLDKPLQMTGKNLISVT